MTALNDELRAAATEIIAVFPRSYTYETSTKTHSATTGTVTKTAIVNHALTGSPPLPFSDAYLPAVVVRKGEAMVLFDAASLSFVPKPGDQLTDTTDSKIWKVVQVDVFSAADTPVLYVVQVRR